MYFAFFYFMSLKWTKTKIVIEITLLLQAYSCLPLVQAVYGFMRIGHEVLIEISFVLVAHSNENPFHHILVCIFIILVIKCEVVNFSRGFSAGANGMPISNFQHIINT